MLRIHCPNCRRIFLQLTAAEDEDVVCPYCGTAFRPKEEEPVDPEDD